MELKWILCIIAAFATVALIVALSLGLLLPRTKQFKAHFIKGCRKSHESCKKRWTLFEEAYIRKDKCEVSMADYNNFFTEIKFDHPCDKTMLWSKTKHLVHKYTTKNTNCFTLEDTELGSTLDNWKWCGKKDSDDTFTVMCPGHKGCENNPVRSFWRSASAKFAEHACGEVTVMLDGCNKVPFNSSSTFGKFELPRLKPPRVKRLSVILITGEKSDCASQNIQDIRKRLHQDIDYTCKEVPKSRIKECVSSADCGACLKRVPDSAVDQQKSFMSILIGLAHLFCILI